MNLWDYLVKHHLSVAELAKKLNCSREHLSRIVHGSQQPSKKLAVAIEKVTKGEVRANFLNIETASLYSCELGLWEYLQKKKMSITDFCKLINYSRVHLSRIINGKLRPSKKLAEAIEKATDGEVKAADLLMQKVSLNKTGRFGHSS